MFIRNSKSLEELICIPNLNFMCLLLAKPKITYIHELNIYTISNYF